MKAESSRVNPSELGNAQFCCT